MVTGKQYAERAWYYYNYKPQIGYIYGCSASAEVWTEAKQKALEEKYARTKNPDLKISAEYGSKWIGHKVLDCSGLTCRVGGDLGLTYCHGSNSSYNKDCAHKGKKTTDMKLPVGAWVYTGDSKNRGHIGIVADSEYVIECQGTKTGITKTKISNKKWTWWGLGKDMQFDFIPGVEQGIGDAVSDRKTETTKNTKVTYPTIRRGTTGDLVAQLQTLLSKDGSSLQIDGIFGPGTQSAVKAFQKKHGLLVDGIVGPQTWGALLKLI